MRPVRAFGGTPAAPATPTIGIARAANSTSATVTFIAPSANGGTGNITYTATASPGGLTGSVSQAGSGTITVSGLTAGTFYTFTVTATNSAGTSAASAATNSIDTTYYLGGTGPGGGIIFYDAGSIQAWGRYLEVAPNTWYGGSSDPILQWSRNYYTDISVNNGLGAGSANTDAMIALDTAAGYAATAARAYAGVGGTTLGQWFVPAPDELNLLCSYFTGQARDAYGNYYNGCSGDATTGRSGTGGFTGNDYYWTSADNGVNYASGINLNNGRYDTSLYKNNGYRVRPVRAFGGAI